MSDYQPPAELARDWANEFIERAKATGDAAALVGAVALLLGKLAAMSDQVRVQSLVLINTSLAGHDSPWRVVEREDPETSLM
jgi:hypothetical protein